MKTIIGIMLFVIGLATFGNAQQEAKVTAEVIAVNSTKIVKGVPFTAEAVSESVQTLVDGNKITRTSTVKLYRDTEGRFRREGLPGTGGAVGSYYGIQTSIFILDPVEGISFILSPETKTARRAPFNLANGEKAIISNAPLAATKAQIETIAGQNTVTVVSTAPMATSPTAVTIVKADTKYDFKNESLGVRTFEGVEAEGHRSTMTIPAGAIGNERPIEVVYETWYSKELQQIVYSRNYDPRFGEHIYRLININRVEPDRSLFTVPSDYKILTEPAAVTTTIKAKP